MRLTVLAACPGSEARPHLPDLDYDLYFALGTEDGATFEQSAVNVKHALELRARQVWLRPGVPKLHSMVIQYLSNRANLVMSLLEFQQKYGYSETRQLVEQFKICLYIRVMALSLILHQRKTHLRLLSIAPGKSYVFVVFNFFFAIAK